MKLPNLSYMMSVAELRYIQAHLEKPAYRNPDQFVGAFLSVRARLRCLLRGTVFLSRVRANPFYPYVLARTKHYDQVFAGALDAGVRCIVNIGCGSDTRAHRFARTLADKGVTVVECDQQQAIRVKREIAERAWPQDRVEYMALDLNDGAWPEFEKLLSAHEGARILVMLEGVSPYISTTTFEAFLRLLATRLAAGSRLAYDFKLAGVAEDFGRSARSDKPFRLPGNSAEVAAYHQALGYRMVSFASSAELSRRSMPDSKAVFEEDALVELEIDSPRA